MLSAASAGLVAGGCARVQPDAQDASIIQQDAGPGHPVGNLVAPPAPDARVPSGCVNCCGICAFPQDAGMSHPLIGKVVMPPGLVPRPFDDAGEADGGS